jgi:hypothetical protein
MDQSEINFWLIMLILHLMIFGVAKLRSTLVCPLFGAVLLEARCILHFLVFLLLPTWRTIQHFLTLYRSFSIIEGKRL